MGILNVIEVLVGVPGNCLVIIAVLLSRKLQTALNAFIVNLAVADLVTCLVLTLHIVGDWARYYFHSLEPICQVALSITHTCIGCGVFTLATIALNRFLLVLTPRSTYQQIFRPRHIVIWIILLWSISAMISILPPLAFNIGKLGFDLPTQSCLSLTDFPTSKQYEHILVFGFYPVPLVIIIVCYTGILIKVVKHNKRLKHNKEPGGESRATCSNERSEFQIENTSRKEQIITPMEIRVTKNFFFVFCAYVICLTPYAICSFTKCAIAAYTGAIVIANSVVNPFIYGLNHPIFREVFISFFKCRPVPEPSTILNCMKRMVSTDSN